jgi:hypothetical protein
MLGREMLYGQKKKQPLGREMLYGLMPSVFQQMYVVIGQDGKYDTSKCNLIESQMLDLMLIAIQMLSSGSGNY